MTRPLPVDDNSVSAAPERATGAIRGRKPAAHLACLTRIRTDRPPQLKCGELKRLSPPGVNEKMTGLRELSVNSSPRGSIKGMDGGSLWIISTSPWKPRSPRLQYFIECGFQRYIGFGSNDPGEIWRWALSLLAIEGFALSLAALGLCMLVRRNGATTINANRGLYLAVGRFLPSRRASNGGLIAFEMAKSPCRDDLRRNSRLGRYLSIASSVCWIADGGTRNRPE